MSADPAELARIVDEAARTGTAIPQLSNTHGEMSIADDRRPRRLKSKAGPQDAWAPGTMHGASSAATPSKGGTTWS